MLDAGNSEARCWLCSTVLVLKWELMNKKELANNLWS
jgi:hypothetical protein